MDQLPIDYARRLAPTNPLLAYQLVQVAKRNRLLGSYDLSYRFTSGVVDAPAQATFPTTLGEDFFVVDIRSTVQRPNAFAGSIFKAQSDFYNAMQSGIYVKLQVVGGPPGSKYIINDNFTPLEVIAPNANGQGKSVICGMDATLLYSQTVRADLTLRRAYPESELPLDMTIAFLGWSLQCCDYRNALPPGDAVAYLRGLPEMESVNFSGRG